MSTTRSASPTRRRSTLALGVGAVLAILVAGCTSAVQQEGQPPASTPKAGGTLNIVQTADVSPTTMLAQNNPNLTVNRLIFNFLIHLDHKTLEPQPELASEWKLSDDQKSITFTLRDDVVFHDGRKFTADDVIGSVKAIQRPDVSSQMKHVAVLITDMKKVDDTHVTLTLDHAVSNLFDLFEMMPIIDIDTFDELLTGKTFNGTGPFKVDDYNPGQGMTLSRNVEYWKQGQPYLDGVKVTVVRDSQSALSSLRSGQSQLALDLAPLDATSVKNDPRFKLVESDANDSTLYIASNVTVPLLADKAVRQAISYAIDRERILKQVQGGIGSVTSLPWSPNSPAYDENEVNHYAYDAAKAKQLLADQGVAGSPVNIYYDAGFGPGAGIAEIAQFNLTEAGLKATAVPLQSPDFLDRLRNGGLDGLFVTGHGFGQLSPATLVKGSFPFNAEKNASSFDNAEYKDLANQMWRTVDEAEATAVYQKMNDFLLDQQFVSDLVNSTHTYTISSDLQGLSWNMLDYINLDEAHLG
jgi:peptide/nickel transport system substrate-binding protein